LAEPGWQAVSGLGAPTEVTASRARWSDTGFAVGDTCFASPTTGWAYAGDGEAAQCRVLFTADAGATWSPQLAWRGGFYGRLATFGEREAGFALGVSQGDDINGYRPEPRSAGDPYLGPDMFLAGTVDAGTTWVLAPIPDRGTSGFHFLTARQIWLKVWLSGLVRAEDGSYVLREGGERADLMRTRDGGVTWQRLRGMDGVGVTSVCFQSEAEGLLVATGDRGMADLLYRTADGGISWERQPLRLPPGLPASAETQLDFVARPQGGTLLVVSASSRSESERRPRWEGRYAYSRAGHLDWAGPYRLPMVPTRSCQPHHQPVTWAADGRIWAAAGHDLFVADDPAGPWQHRSVPLPAEQLISRVDPVGGGMVWLTTTKSTYPGAMPSGQLFRSSDDGAQWIRVIVDVA
jgi:hypothetical protein